MAKPPPPASPVVQSLFAGASPLGFDASVALAHLAKKDAMLGKLIARVGALRLQPEALQHPFQALVQSICHQQVTGHAAAAILRRFCEALGDGGAFPTPTRVAAATEDELRAVGLSRNKAIAVRDLAGRTLDGTVPDVASLALLEDDAIVERLTAVRGVGVWTVQMLLIFRLGRPDVLPTGDYGVRKGFAVAFRKAVLPTPGEVAKRGERWRPYRSVASWYLWRALELPPVAAAR